MGVRQDESFSEVLSCRIPLKTVRGTAEEDNYGPSVCSTMAREIEI